MNIILQIARRLKLMNIPEYSNISGGEAMELAAKKGDNPYQFDFSLPISHNRDCNFSFSGLLATAMRRISSHEEKYNVRGPDIIPDVNNLCASFFLITARHLCVRTERAMEFLDKKELIPQDTKTLVCIKIYSLL